MSNSSIRILAVDDVAMNLTLLSELLGAAGFVVDTALSAREGLALAHKNHYALLLLDIQLPDFNGDVLLQRLRADATALSTASPAFALTGELSAALKASLLQAGFMEVFVKPWSASTIIASIRRVTGAVSTASDAIKQNVSSEALFDRTLALKTTGGDEKLMLKLRAMLVTELTSKGDLLRQAFEQNDAVVLSELRHKLAGAAGFTGAVALSAALAQLKAESNEASIAAVESAISAIIAAAG